MGNENPIPYQCEVHDTRYQYTFAMTPDSLLADKAQLFASKYQAVMPTEAELQAELERDRAFLEMNQGKGESK